MERNGFGDVAASELVSASSRCDSLKFLGLDENNLGAQTCTAATTGLMQGFRGLEELLLGGIRTEDALLARLLQAATNHRSLKTLARNREGKEKKEEEKRKKERKEKQERRRERKSVSIYIPLSCPSLYISLLSVPPSHSLSL